jgi:peptide/nickel transport system substrate-binding protein
MSRQFSRREMLRFSAVAAGGAAALGSGALSLTGCSTNRPLTSPASFSAGPPAGGTPRRGGTLRVGMISGGNGETLDLRKITTAGDISRSSALYDPLWFVGEYGAVIPGLAESWDSNDKSDLWTIRLRQGVQFHNGKPLTAADVVYTIQNSWLSPDGSLQPVLSQLIDGPNVRTDGPMTVVIPLKRPLAQLPTLASVQNCYIVPQGFTSWDKPIGTGPFVFKSFTPGQRSEFTANDHYWRGAGRPPVDSLVIDSSFVTDETRLNALLGSSIDIMPSIQPALGRANEASGRIYLGNQPGPGWSGACYRVDQGPFADPRVRQAVKLSANRQAAADLLFSGYAVAGNDCVGYTDQYFADDLKSEYDPEKAKSLLKSAGYDGLSFDLTTTSLGATTNPLATLFKEQAKAAGININVNQIDPAIYFTKEAGFQTRPWSMELWTNAVSSLTLFYLFFLVDGAPYQDSFFGNPEHDAQIFAAMAEKDDARAKQKWHDVQVVQHEQGGTINFVNYNWIDGYGLNIRGAKTTNAGPCDNFDFSTTWLEG